MFLGGLLLAIAITSISGATAAEKEQWSIKEMASPPDQNQDSSQHHHLVRGSVLLPGHRAGDRVMPKRGAKFLMRIDEVCGSGGHCLVVFVCRS